jgi:signal transduction histidine kinase
VGASTTGLTGPSRLFLVAGAVAFLGIATAAGADDALKDRDQHTLSRAKSGLAQAVDTRLTNLGNRVDQYTGVLSRTDQQRIDARLAAAPRTDFASFGWLRDRGNVSHPDPQVSHAQSSSANGAQQLSRYAGLSSVQAATSIARDTAAPVSVVVDAPSSASVVVVWPLYAEGVPLDTASRRAGSTGWVIGAAPYAQAFAPILDLFQPLGVHSEIEATAAGPGPIQTVLGAASTVHVTTFPQQSRLPVLLILMVSGVAAITIAGAGFARRRSDRSAHVRDNGMRQQMQLLSDISVTVQESLEVGLVLPAALSQIAQAHQLSYISVATGPENSGRGHIFSIGRVPAGIPGPRWSVGANTAAPGQLVRLPLQRAARTLGFVEFIPREPLGRTDLASLRSTTDLLANALHNAELYEREQDTVRRLRDLDEMKDDFLATVSHELRTPLSVLVGFLSLLSTKWDRLTESDRRDAVDKMQRHTTSLVHLVNDLLDFVNERGNRTAMPEQISLDQHVLAVVDQLRPLCERQQLELHLHDEVHAWTDPRAIERIVGNLVSNAAKYSPAGSTLTIRVESRGDAAVFVVADEGPGIDQEEQQRIFQRFYRGESDAARSTRGSGIGLAVVSEWLEVVGARIDIVTGPEVGTTMNVHFPAHSNAKLDGAGEIRWLETALPRRGQYS